jgi:hypothetical protein
VAAAAGLVDQETLATMGITVVQVETLHLVHLLHFEAHVVE